MIDAYIYVSHHRLAFLEFQRSQRQFFSLGSQGQQSRSFDTYSLPLTMSGGQPTIMRLRRSDEVSLTVFTKAK